MSDEKNRTTRTTKIGRGTTEFQRPSTSGKHAVSNSPKNVQGSVEGRSTTTKGVGGGK